MLEIELWKGAVEPLGGGCTDNEIQAWKGAVEPAFVAPPVSKKGGHIARGRRPKVVFVDQPEEVLEEEPVVERRILRMTPEVRAVLERYKQDKGIQADGSLLGKRKGLT